MATQNMQTKLASVFDTLKETFSYTNVMQTATIEKVIVATGIGKIEDKQMIAHIQDRLALITGQKASPRAARMSIATFKLREGDIVGFQVTLRGGRMRTFLDKLIDVALPQTRDFRGLNATAIDEMGNITLGLKDHTIFPETMNDDLKDVFGLAITIVTTAKTPAEAEALLRHIGLPLKKTVVETK